jgi:hypothetical protein
MTTTIEKRVTRLEATTGGGGRCPECGWDGDPSKVQYVVEWQDPDGSTEPDEFCETCGRQLTCTIHMDWGDSRP